MKRFVVVGTLQRGKVDPPEPLDENGQALAYWRWMRDEACALRGSFESELASGSGMRDSFDAAMRDCKVHWNPLHQGAPARLRSVRGVTLGAAVAEARSA